MSDAKERKLVSECCGAEVTYHQWDEPVEEYDADGRLVPAGITYQVWVCDQCHRPCDVREGKEERDG